jgi:type III secretion protein S
MDTTVVIEASHRVLMLVLLLSLPAVVTSGVVGLLSGIAQAVTQIQDQSVAQALKLIAVLVALGLSSKWIAGTIYHMADQLFTSVGLGATGVQ